MSDRGKFIIRNPAEAIAVAKCWLNTWAKRGPKGMLPDAGTFHPANCLFCEIPRDLLIRALEEFRDWSFISADADEETPLRLEVEQWLALPAHEQQRLVAKAQNEAAEDKGQPWWTD